MPVVTRGGERGSAAQTKSALPGDPEKDQKSDQTEEHVQTVKAGESEECGREKVCADIDSGLKQFPVLESLANQEDSAQCNSEREPTKHGAAMPFAQGNLGSPNSETAREKAKAKNQRPPDRKFLRSGTGLRPGIEIQVGEQENRKEPSFGKDEGKNANLALVRTLDF